ncbi:MAG: leucine-rich repeat protein, partial [Peptococcaceae bacterium]|nr:leucine-rich repeat protein [Peptococcaceae bacterium]
NSMKSKKLISLLLSVALLGSTLPTAAFATDAAPAGDKTVPGWVDENNGHPKTVQETFDFVEDNIAYKTVGDNEVEVAQWYWKWTHSCESNKHVETVFAGTEYSGRDTLTIPTKIEHNGQRYTVVGIGQDAFYEMSGTEVELQEGIRYIADGAFKNASCKAIEIPASVTRIGDDGLRGDFESITFAQDSQLESIGNNAFRGCKITTIDLPKKVTSLGGTIFQACKQLGTVTIPASVTNIQTTTFDNFYDATANDGNGNLVFEEGSIFKVQDGVLYDSENLIRVLELLENVVVPEGIKYIAAGSFDVYDGPEDEYTLKSITLPSTLVSVGDLAFRSNKALESITIPESVTELGSSAFRECSGLKSVTILGHVEKLSGAFYECTSLESVVLPDSITEISRETFKNCKKLDLEKLPTSLEKIGYSAFEGCESLSQIAIPSGVTEIPEFTFAGCLSLEKVVLPEGITSIGDYAFDLTAEDVNGNYGNDHPQLESINIPSTVTTIGDNFLGGVKENGETALIFDGEVPPTFSSDALAGIAGDGINHPTVYYPATETAKQNYTDSSNELVKNSLISTKPEDADKNTFALAVDPISVSLTVGDKAEVTVTSTVPSDCKLSVATSNDNATATLTDGVLSITGAKAGQADVTVSIAKTNGGGVVAEKTVAITVTEKTVIPPSVSKYAIAIDQADNGSIAADKSAVKGKVVTITATPDAGYKVDAVTVTTRAGKRVSVTANADGTYSFTMPASTVTISASFVKDGEEPPTPVELPFTDVSAGDWFYEPVQFVFAQGLMTGTSATEFSPNLATSRGMIVTMLYRMEGEPDLSDEILGYPFADVDANAYYGDAVYWARLHGIVSGYSSESFGPNDSVTREQLAAILYNYATYKGVDTSARADLSKYADAGSISGWATDAVQWVNAAGIVNGMTDTSLAPQGEAARAQVAAMLQRCVENIMA